MLQWRGSGAVSPHKYLNRHLQHYFITAEVLIGGGIVRDTLALAKRRARPTHVSSLRKHRHDRTQQIHSRNLVSGKVDAQGCGCCLRCRETGSQLSASPEKPRGINMEHPRRATARGY